MQSTNPSIGRRHAWLMAAYYFFLYGAVGCVGPYLPLYYQHAGLNDEQIGLLMGLGPVVLIVAGPLWGALGDRFNLHRRLLPIATVGALTPMFLIPLTHDLTLLIVIVLIQSFFAQAIGPLMDSAALEIAEATQIGFGQLRLGGSVGFTIISVAVGWLLTRVGLEWMFYSYMASLAAAALIALALPVRRERLQAPLWQGLRTLLKQRSLVFFLLAAFMVGVSANAASFFFPLYLNSIGGDSNILGIAGAVAALTEIPVLYNGSLILKKLGGLWFGVAAGILTYVLRWFALSFATTPLAVIAMQITHGPSFGLFIVAGVAYVDAQAPPGLSATAQSLFIVAMWGLGAFAGSLAGGYVYQHLGGAALFQLCGLGSLLAFVLLFGVRPVVQTAGTPAT